MPHKSYRQESKKDWGINIPEATSLTIEQVNTGALLRIADATELMASNYKRLQEDVKMYKGWWEERKRTCDKLQRQVNAYKGIVKKLKKK